MQPRTLAKQAGATLTALALTLAVADSASAAAIVRITEWMYNGDEFIEFTNVGDEAISLAGWSFDDDSQNPGTVSLDGFGILQAGQSAILAESSAVDFRAAWGLGLDVPVIGGNSTNLGRADEINLYDQNGVLVDRLTYGDNAPAGGPRTQNVSGNILPANLGLDLAPRVELSVPGDAFGSYLSSSGFPGNPGSYPSVPEPATLLALGVGLSALAVARRRGIA